jgi:teichuronic acid biosynthesis glycosyltransferase TuaH
MQLVWLAEVPWAGLRQRHHHLVRRLPPDWPVVFVEPLLPRDVPPVLGQLLGARPPRRWRHVTITAAAPLVNLRHPAARQLLAQPAVRRLAERLAARLLAATVRRLVRGPIDCLITSNVYFAAGLRALAPRWIVYDCCDDPAAFPDAPPWTEACFHATVRQADLVLASSSALLERVRQVGARQSALLGNGVDLAHYTRLQPEPVELAALPRPIVGYIGHLGPWLDVATVAAAARALPHVSFVLIGPVALTLAERQALALPNVHLLGPRPYAQLPAYVQRFAVGLIPFRCTALTRAVNPNKLYEYAACNLPVVATPFSAEIVGASPPVTLAATPAEFAAAVATRLADAGPPTRPLAEEHSWDALAAQVTALLAKLAAARGGGVPSHHAPEHRHGGYPCD